MAAFAPIDLGIVPAPPTLTRQHAMGPAEFEVFHAVETAEAGDAALTAQYMAAHGGLNTHQASADAFVFLNKLATNKHPDPEAELVANNYLTAEALQLGMAID